MKNIKGSFVTTFSHVHRESHRTSDGFKYHYYDTTTVTGPFFSEELPLTYQELAKLQEFSIRIKTTHHSCEDDYEWAESYTSDWSTEDSTDWGLCTYFNTLFSEKYGIRLIKGNVEECALSIQDMSVWKTFLKASNDASAKQKNAQDELSNALMENLLEPLKSNIRLFDMNLPFCDNLYPLDIAIHTNDEELLNSLVENGAFHYSSEFNPHISAKTGNFAKALELLRSNPVTDDSIIKVLTFIISLPDTEFYALLENKRSDLKRNGCILITYFEKLRLLVIMRDFFFRDKTPLKRAIESLLQARAFAKANYVFDRARELCLYIGEEDMLEASFRYGNIEYINRWDLWNLVNTITERFKYSHAFARLEYDSRGDILKFKWNFEPYVKPENIGNEMYHKIMDEIENHSSRYCI